jgi:hypothetical protein
MQRDPHQRRDDSRHGTATGIRTHRRLTPTSVEGAEACGVPNADEDDVPYTGTRNAAPTSAAPHTNAPRCTRTLDGHYHPLIA